MSSVSGLIGNFGQTNYGAAKAGIAGFSRSLSMEMAKYKCSVNTISPGAATRLTIDLMKAAGREVDENDWKQGPQQIAPVIAWLSSEEANEITNQIFHISQGNVGIMQQPAVIKSFKSDESIKIPDNLIYDDISGLSNEVKFKLNSIKPATLGQAQRIEGITPAAITLLLMYLKRYKFKHTA